MPVTTHLAIGTRKGLWLARADDGRWVLDGPHFAMQEVPSIAWEAMRDTTTDGAAPRLLVGVRSEHWGPTVASTNDLGVSWDEPDHGAIRFPEETGAALERVWQIAPDPQRPGIVWAGCEPTSVWRSSDGGRSFELNRSLWDHPHRPHWFPGAGGAAVHTILPHPVDDDRTLVAMSTGGVYSTVDGGAAWNPVNRGIQAVFLPEPERFPEYGQCVHKVAVDATDPDRLYAQNHHGVYRSDDAGGSWTSIAEGLPADFGFVALAHPSAGGTAWVVPLVADVTRFPPGGELRVWRTSDGGESWIASSAGLPDGCWNTVLRDAACATAGPDGGAQLFVGTRDGFVFGSTDDGDTFDEVTRHLPDVLCVRALHCS